MFSTLLLVAATLVVPQCDRQIAKPRLEPTIINVGSEVTSIKIDLTSIQLGPGEDLLEVADIIVRQSTKPSAFLRKHSSAPNAPECHDGECPARSGWHPRRSKEPVKKVPHSSPSTDQKVLEV